MYILHHGPTKAFSKIVPLKCFRFEEGFFSISDSISYTYSLVNSSIAEFAGRFNFLIDIVRVVQLTERWCCFAGNLFLEDKNICSFVKVRIRNGGVCHHSIDDTFLKYQTTLSAICLFVLLFVYSLYGSCFPFFFRKSKTSRSKPASEKEKERKSISLFSHPQALALAVKNPPRFLFSWARSTIFKKKIEGP